jgi:hypothetical protein
MFMAVSADATLKNRVYYYLHYLRLEDWHIKFNQTVIKINKILLKIKTLIVFQYCLVNFLKIKIIIIYLHFQMFNSCIFPKFS